MSDTDFEQLQTALASGGAESLFQHLIDQLRSEKKYHELFDALLLQARHRLGLPIILTAPLDDLAEPVRSQVEEAYLKACREVGSLLLGDGEVRASWMYLRPLGDKQLVAEGLARLEPDDDNLPDIIEVALHEGMAPELGFRLVLEHHGTCNAISTYEAAMSGRSRGDQQLAAGLLVRHLHGELVANVREEIRRQEGADPSEERLSQLIADRDWLFLNNNYHIDTSHLAAVVRFARVIDAPEVLRLAVELTEYGRRLSRQFQFPGEEPFVDLYVTHALFFRTLLREDADTGLEFFRDRAAAAEAADAGTAAAETYVGLLARLGRHREAADAAATLLPARARSTGVAPTLLELSHLAGSYDRLLETAEANHDLVTYSTALLARKEGTSAGTVAR